MASRRLENWLLLVIPALVLIPVAIVGLWAYMAFTATPLHPTEADVPSTTRQAPLPAWTDAVEQGRRHVRATLAGQNLPGLSVAVGVDGDLVWAEGFGWADLEQRVAVAPETKFRIGTASIALTSAAAGLLLEQDRLRLDEHIQTYVPEFPKKPWAVTLGQLMGHLAGVRTDSGDEGPLFSQHCERPVDALRHFAERSLLFEPGTEYRYSSYGWIVVSAAVETAAAMPFLTFMRTQLFDPLGMRDTEADSDALTPNRATFYFPGFGADPTYGLHLMRPLDYSCYAGASVFLSTPSDLVRFGLAITQGRLLQPDTVALLQRSQRLASGEETGYGLGWDIDTVSLAGEDTRAVGHDGDSLGGPVATLLTFPDRGLVVAVMANISYADPSGVALTIAQAFAAAP